MAKKTGRLPRRASDAFAQITALLVLTLFCVHPLVISPDTYYNITITKLISYLVIMGLFALLCAAALVLYRREVFATPISLKLRPYEYALLAYWLVMLVSALLSDYRREAFLGASKRSEGFLMMSVYLLSVVVIGRLYQFRERHLTALCEVACLVSAYGILQYYGIDFLHLAPVEVAGIHGPDLVYISTMSNRNFLSTYLCLAFCACLVLFSASPAPATSKFKCKWQYLFMGWILFYMLLLGQTEAGYVGILFSVALLLPLLLLDLHSAGRFFLFLSGCCLLVWVSVQLHDPAWQSSVWTPLAPWFLLAAFVLAVIAPLLWHLPTPFPPFIKITPKIWRIVWYTLLVILMIATLVAIPKLAHRTGHPILQEAAEILQGNFDDTFGSNRLFIWKRTLRMVPDKPLFGHGPDTFYPAFMARFGEEAIAKNYNRYDKAHNEYLQILFDNGALGLLSLLSFAGLIIAGLVKRCAKPAHAAILLALACFLIQAFFSFSTPFAHPLVWAFWGIGASLLYQKESPTPAA